MNYYQNSYNHQKFVELCSRVRKLDEKWTEVGFAPICTALFALFPEGEANIKLSHPRYSTLQ